MNGCMAIPVYGVIGKTRVKMVLEMSRWICILPQASIRYISIHKINTLRPNGQYHRAIQS